MIRHTTVIGALAALASLAGAARAGELVCKDKIIGINASCLSLTGAQTIADVLTERFNRRIDNFANAPPKVALILWES